MTIHMRNLADKRSNLCKSLVGSHARVVRDGSDHSSKVNRCIAGGKCVGYYEVLTGYDEAGDTFSVGLMKQIPAGQVDEVAVFDAIASVLNVVETSVHAA